MTPTPPSTRLRFAEQDWPHNSGFKTEYTPKNEPCWEEACFIFQLFVSRSPIRRDGLHPNSDGLHPSSDGLAALVHGGHLPGLFAVTPSSESSQRPARAVRSATLTVPSRQISRPGEVLVTGGAVWGGRQVDSRRCFVLCFPQLNGR